jgi:3-methyl-2-oxobutanoate hydroxymethyltransferase
MLGMFSDFTPKFVKRYANIGEAMTNAFRAYIDEVSEGVFPAAEHGYGISNEVIEKLY